MKIKKNKQFLLKFNNFLTIFKKYFKVLSKFNEDIFIIFLIIYLILNLIQQLWENDLKDFINPNYTLVFLIVSGIIYSLSVKNKVAPKKYKIKSKDIILIILLGILGSYLIWFRLKQWEILSYFISISLGIFIICFLYLFLKND
ncbi:hypothetical protein ES703_43013 [subsurface metagenome]